MFRYWIPVGSLIVLPLFVLVIFCRNLPNEQDPDQGTPGIVIEKTTNGEDADSPTGPIISVGDSVKWMYTISNIGDGSISDVTITDNVPNVIPVYQSGDDGDGVLESGEEWIYWATGMAVLGQYTNIGNASGIESKGTLVTASDSSHYLGIIGSQSYAFTVYSIIVSSPVPADITLPHNKLPWPHQPPGISQPDFYQLIKDIWLFNNFGRYNANIEGSSMYFHDGLDPMLDNGTKIYAVDSGTVMYIGGGSEYYQTITIQDKSGYAWSYIHVNNFQFEVGDSVIKGDYIADVHFHGMPHVHIARVYNTGGPWNDYSNLHYLCPDNYFLYEDTEAPIIKKPFYYFHNKSDTRFDDTRPAVIHGDVDIVVGMREVGEYSRMKETGLGDRNCIARIEYEISGAGIQPVHKYSFDFMEMSIQNWGSLGRERVKTVFKHWDLFHTPDEMNDYSFWDKTFSYYIITNTSGTAALGLIDVNDRNFAWNTDEVDGAGNRLFPDGLYVVTVRAYDFLGNYTVASETVIVDNP